MLVPRAASPPCTPSSPCYPPLPNGEGLSWPWHDALTWPKDVWHLSSLPWCCPTVLPQLRLCVSKLNFSPDGEIAVQGSGWPRPAGNSSTCSRCQSESSYCTYTKETKIEDVSGWFYMETSCFAGPGFALLVLRPALPEVPLHCIMLYSIWFLLPIIIF